jgi:hypothetical protein
VAILPVDVTLDFVFRNGLVNKREDYIAGIYGNARAFAVENGPWVVRLGASGTGHAPNYRIEFATSPPKATPEELKAGLKGTAYIPAVAARAASNTLSGVAATRS